MDLSSCYSALIRYLLENPHIVISVQLFSFWHALKRVRKAASSMASSKTFKTTLSDFLRALCFSNLIAKAIRRNIDSLGYSRTLATIRELDSSC